ncbi:MAG: response regulator [Burkholderiales bacterium]
MDFEPNNGVVLIVDDVPENLSLLSAALDDAGYVVLVARDGESALKTLQRTTPDIVLLDAVMPGLDGFQTCERIKQMEEARQVPVIFMTALTETSHVLRGFAAGATDYVTKPIRIDEVLARVATHLASARHLWRVRAALENSGQALLIANAKGHLIWRTPRAAALLDRYLAPETNSLPHLSGELGNWLCTAIHANANTWMPLRATGQTHGQLSLRLSGRFGNNEYLFELEERSSGAQLQVLAGQFNLTSREAEVLLWASMGKTSRDIGVILNISSRTADKHLEHVYVKLGVETRTAAVAIALRSLQSALPATGG